MQIYQPQLKLMSFCTVQLRIVSHLEADNGDAVSVQFRCVCVCFFMNVGWSLQSSADR